MTSSPPLFNCLVGYISVSPSSLKLKHWEEGLSEKDKDKTGIITTATGIKGSEGPFFLPFNLLMLSASSSSVAVANGKVKGMDPSSQRSQSSNNNKDIKKIFEAAVNVIRNLPPDAKDGQCYFMCLKT